MYDSCRMLYISCRLLAFMVLLFPRTPYLWSAAGELFQPINLHIFVCTVACGLKVEPRALASRNIMCQIMSILQTIGVKIHGTQKYLVDHMCSPMLFTQKLRLVQRC